MADNNKLDFNPDSALNPAWETTEKDLSAKADFAVVPPSQYDTSVPATGKKEKKEKEPKQPKEKKEKKEKAPKEPKEGNNKTKIIIAAIALVLVAAIALAAIFVFLPLAKYGKANKLFAQGKYDDAIAAFTALGDYKDSPQKIEEVKAAMIDQNYNKAVETYDNGDFEAAQAIFEELGDYKDTADYISSCNYQLGVKALAAKDYEAALKYFEASDLDEAAEHIKECQYQVCKADDTNSEEIYNILKALADEKYKDSAKLIKEKFKWSFTTQINNDEDDLKNSPKTVDTSKKIYFHFQINGGAPNDTLKIKVAYKLNNGKEKFFKFEDEYHAGQAFYASVKFPDGEKNTGEITFTIYDEKDNVLATQTAKLK